MVCHLLESISFVKIDGCWLRVHHEANAAYFAGNSRYAVNGVEEEVLTDAFSLVPFGYCQSAKSEYRNSGR